MYKHPALPRLCVGFFSVETSDSLLRSDALAQPGLLRDATEGGSQLLGLQWWAGGLLRGTSGLVTGPVSFQLVEYHGLFWLNTTRSCRWGPAEIGQKWMDLFRVDGLHYE